MIGFYLNKKIKDKSVLRMVSLPQESFTESHCQSGQGLYIFEEEHRQMVQLAGCTVFNIGTLIYKNTWHKKALSLIASDLSEGKTIREVASDTKGQFCLIIQTAESIFIVTDRLGSFPIYIYRDEGSIQVSNIIIILAKNSSVSINHQAVAEYLSFDYCFGDTVFSEIKTLSMATIYQFTTELKTQVYDNVFADIRFHRHTNLREAAGMAREILRHNLSFFSPSDRVFVDVTGGFDTRTVVALLQDIHVKYEAGICGEQVAGELKSAKEITQALGVKFSCDIKIIDSSSFDRLLKKHFAIGTGVPLFYHSTELINYYEHIRQHYDVHLTGYGGTELTKQTLPKLSLFSSTINQTLLFQKYGYKYLDIFTDHFVTRASYYEELKRKIDSLLHTIGSRKHDEVANYLRLCTFTRHYAGCLIGTHNVIVPFYSPFIEANYVRLMMEVSYDIKAFHQIQRAIVTALNPELGRIMTTHGYNADIRWKKCNAISRILRSGVKAMARRAAYEFRFYEIAKLLRDRIWSVEYPAGLEEVQRAFWVDKVNSEWSEELAVFDLLDRDKLKRILMKMPDASKLKAKVLYLNKIIEACNPSL